MCITVPNAMIAPSYLGAVELAEAVRRINGAGEPLNGA